MADGPVVSHLTLQDVLDAAEDADPNVVKIKVRAPTSDGTYDAGWAHLDSEGNVVIGP